MSQLIYDFYSKIKDHKWVNEKKQWPFAVFGGLLFLFFTYLFIKDVFFNLSDIKRPEFIAFDISINIFSYIFCGIIGLFLIAMGLFSTTTEIDLQNRKVRIIRRNFRGQQAINEMPLDDIRVNATRMGITDANPTDIWIVKAGFFLENENGEEYDVAIYSKETANIQDRNKIMLELYHFFFPDQQLVNENNIITNGTAIMLLSDRELVEFKNGTLFQDKQKSEKKVDPGSKWDRIL
jgi:hypothetical protein